MSERRSSSCVMRCSTTLLVGILGYAVEHGFAGRNAAVDMDKLPAVAGEGDVIASNVLKPAELRKVIDAAVDPWAWPIMFAAPEHARPNV